MKPYIVSAVLDEKGETVQRTAAQVVAHPIREETSETMRSLLEQVVSEGGGHNAYIEGYRVGGKTGTAQVYVDGKVSTSVHIGSFIGFAPADHPRFAVLVIVNAAEVPVDYGGTTAAPFARQIIADTLDYLGIQKAGAEEQKMVSVPDVRGMTLEEAARVLRAVPLKWETDGAADVITAQMPPPGAELAAGGQMMLYTAPQDAVTPEVMVAVPDVLGMSVVEASRALRARGLELRMEGSGIAAAQSPGAGIYAAPGTEVKVRFVLP